MEVVSANDLDFSLLLMPGDRIVASQGLGEPLTLTRRLMSTPTVPPGCRLFIGPVYSNTLKKEPPRGLRFESYGAIGNAAALSRTGQLDIFPWHYSAMTAAFGDGSLRADCVLLQGSRARGGDSFCAGVSNDYALQAARHARLVIVELCDDLPPIPGSEFPADIRIDAAVRSGSTRLSYRSPDPKPECKAIAAHAATIVPDRAVLQFGVGAIPEQIVAALGHHRDLGVHSGVAVDAMIDLVEDGVITNAFKEIDPGISVAGTLLGSRRLFDFAASSGKFRLAAATHTHSLSVIARLSRFCAINSAVEVDLSGQVNSEIVNGHYVGAVGGQVDFVRGANYSREGRAIIALPSTAAGGTISRIVPRVSTVTCPRSDIDAIVTEWGAAELRGRTLSQRAKALIEIAAPKFREQLTREWFALSRNII